MSKFEKEFFRKVPFTADEIKQYLQSALKDLDIAQKDKFTEVRFSYAYQALIKAGIALLAKKGGVKVKSVPGHHIKILNKLSTLLEDDDIFTYGNAIRMKRNQDLYSGGEYISKKEADECLEFVESVLKRVKKLVSTTDRRGQ